MKRGRTPDEYRHNVAAWARLERHEHTQSCSADRLLSPEDQKLTYGHFPPSAKSKRHKPWHIFVTYTSHGISAGPNAKKADQ